MVKIKLYFKPGLGFTFYFSIALALIMLSAAVYQSLSSQWLRVGIDLALGILVGYTSISMYKNRDKLKEQEVEVEKYEEIK